jgi:hypothetical protein
VKKSIVLDTDIVIHLLKKQTECVERFIELFEKKHTFLVSSVVVAEIYAGAFEREYEQIESLFGLCQLIDTNYEIGKQAGIYAKAYRKAFQAISLEDYLLAASAKIHNALLWTGNRKHYPMTDIEFI